VVALGGVAAEGGQLVQCVGVLDAFGDDLEAEVAAEVDGGSDDDRVPGAGGQPGDEGPVDFQATARGRTGRWLSAGGYIPEHAEP
jgi:hypothetical protein